MAHESLTWQILPKFLLDPVLEGVLTLSEASEMLDLELTGQPAPQRLMEAVDRLGLFHLPTYPGLH